MSDSEFLKGGCRHCGGHIEFPAAAAGQTAACPHCGQPTVLEGLALMAGRGAGRIGWTVAAIVLVLVAVAAGVLLKHRPAPAAANGVTAVVTNPVSEVTAKIPATPAPEPEPPPPTPSAVTNGFAIMPYHLEPVPGSSLVYVVGSVRNNTPRQRFGVKVEFGLFDTNDTPIGAATDYQSVLDAHAEWRFKAMVMASKTTAARFKAIAEDQ